MTRAPIAAGLVALACACTYETHSLPEPNEVGSGAPEPAGGTAGQPGTPSGGQGHGGAQDGPGGAVGAGGWVGSGGELGTGGPGQSGGSGGIPDPGPEEPAEFPLPAALVESGACWREPGDYPACRPVPELDPPVIEWSCGTGHGGKAYPGQETVARLRIPPRSCMRIMGRFALSISGTCTIDPSAGCMVDLPEHSCVTVTNTTAEDMFRYVTRRRDCDLGWGVSWYADECEPC